MADQTTPLGLVKPGVSDPSGANTWGTKTNSNWDLVDQLITALQSAPARVVGEVINYAGSKAPAKWLMCDGSAVSRTTYSALYAVVGTTFGAGDGSSTFNLPDARARVVMGSDTMSGTNATGGTATNRVTKSISGVDASTPGAVGGDQRLQGHNHATVPNQLNICIGNAFSGNPGAGGSNGIGTTDLSSYTTGSTGAGASQNVQPSIVMAKIIYAGA